MSLLHSGEIPADSSQIAVPKDYLIKMKKEMQQALTMRKADAQSQAGVAFPDSKEPLPVKDIIESHPEESIVTPQTNIQAKAPVTEMGAGLDSTQVNDGFPDSKEPLPVTEVGEKVEQSPVISSGNIFDQPSAVATPTPQAPQEDLIKDIPIDQVESSTQTQEESVIVDGAQIGAEKETNLEPQKTNLKGLENIVTMYQIQPDDTIYSLSDKWKIPAEKIAELNNHPDGLIPGKFIAIPFLEDNVSNIDIALLNIIFAKIQRQVLQIQKEKEEGLSELTIGSGL